MIHDKQMIRLVNEQTEQFNKGASIEEKEAKLHQIQARQKELKAMTRSDD